MLTYWVDVYVSISLPSFFSQPNTHSPRYIPFPLPLSLSHLFSSPSTHTACASFSFSSLLPPPSSTPSPYFPPPFLLSLSRFSSINSDPPTPNHHSRRSRSPSANAADFSRFPRRHHRYDCQRRLRH